MLPPVNNWSLSEAAAARSARLDQMGHEHHDHGAAARRAGARHVGRLAIVFGLLLAFFVVELVVGLTSGSLAVLSDAGHMLTDVVGIGMAWAAVTVASRRQRNAQHTFGLYRLEILAAVMNAVLLFAVAVYVVIEALSRLDQPPEVAGGPVIAVAVAGLLVNLVAFWYLRPAAAESLNLEGAYLEVVADLLGSVAVLIAGVVIALTGWGWVDPVFGAAIGVFILPRTWRLGRQAFRILVQSAPPEIDIADLEACLGSLDGVVEVHDLHVWTLTSEMEVATAHLVVGTEVDHHGILDQARHLLQERFGIEHATLQVEPETHEGCEQVDW